VHGHGREDLNSQIGSGLHGVDGCEYRISDDKNLLSLDTVCDYLKRSYWAADRSRAAIEKSIQNYFAMESIIKTAK
jgi:hypothetical protein